MAGKTIHRDGAVLVSLNSKFAYSLFFIADVYFVTSATFALSSVRRVNEIASKFPFTLLYLKQNQFSELTGIVRFNSLNLCTRLENRALLCKII